MKTALLTAFFSILFCLNARAQPCWPNGIQLQSQFDVDNIASLSQGCSSVAGSVTISGPNITNLDSLRWITAIDGNLWIFNNPALTSLQGLSNLVSVSGTVNIFGNASLENFTGFDLLQTIGGSLLITENAALLNIDSLNSLTSIGADLYIGSNPQLLNVDGLSSLTTVPQTLSIGGNNALVSLSGLDNLTSIGLDAYFSEMNNLLNLDGMNNLKTIGGSLWIGSFAQLSDISGFQTLDTIAGGLTLISNEALTSFRGGGNPVSIGDSIMLISNPLLNTICPLRQPASIKSLSINGTGLNNLDFLQPLIAVERNLLIAFNESLSELNAFNQLETVGQDLWIEGNNLENLNNFQQLKNVGGSLIVRQYNSLSSLSGLEKLDSIGNSLELACPNLNSLKALDSLKFVGGDLKLLGLDSISSLKGLEGLSAIGGSLEVIGTNLKLPNLTGLDSLKSVGRNVLIQGNTSLANLKGLGNLASVGRRFTVSYNAALSNCVVEGLCSQLEISPDSVFIEFNAFGCNSTAEVKAQCDLPPGQCLLNGITFTLQTEVDKFPINYPGCTEILGDVFIYQSDITNLDSLNVLIKLGKQLNIEASHLTNLGGLQNITSIGGDFKIGYSDSLSGFNGLKNLTSIGGTFEVNGSNAKIQNLNGLDSLKSVGRNIFLHNNWALKNLRGIENLHSIGGRFSVLNNPVLSDCVVESLCRQLEVLPDSVFIENNASGCDAPATVKMQCDIPPGQCLLNGITFDSQDEVDHFAINYPGCKQIMGPVLVAGPGITTLDSLHVLTGLGNEFVIDNTMLTSFTGLDNITFIAGELRILGNNALTSLTGLGQVKSVLSAIISGNPSLTSLDGLDSLTHIENIIIQQNSQLTSLSGISNVASINGLGVFGNDVLPNLSGLEHITTMGGLSIYNNPSLTSLNGLNNLISIERDLEIGRNDALLSLAGLDNLTTIENSLSISEMSQLSDLSGLGQLSSIGGATGGGFEIRGNNTLASLSGLDNLSTIGGAINIMDNPLLANLSGLQNISFQGFLVRIQNNDALTDLTGLENISMFNYLEIRDNASLISLAGLESLNIVNNIEITSNPSLSDCAIFAVCNQLLNNPSTVYITDNATGCNTPAEVEALCNSIPVIAEVRLDNNSNCQSDAADTPASGVHVSLEGMAQMLLKPTDNLGFTRFSYLESGPFSMHLPQFPAGYWTVCQEPILLDPGGSTDTIRTTFLLSPLAQCPELSVELGMPSFFRGCLVTTDMEVSVVNTGTLNAEGVKTAIVLPPVLELLAADPPLDAQVGDTLYFDLGEMPAFDKKSVLLTVRTKCDTFLFSQTLCVETFASLDNACPTTPIAFSEIKLSATCLGDTLVRFILKNIGDAPTQGLHSYTLIRNETIVETANFNLANQQSMAVDVPADGATYRMEATKFDDGTLTAVALENCGGLTPGWITAFWLEQGPLEYDFDCRQVIGSYDPNQKTAVPTGTAPNYMITANRPIQYTIDFQNTGTDTAYRVLLRDVLPNTFDLNSFRAGASSHPGAWEIRGNTLDVLFFPIALPDSNVNEPASRGFFSFELDQMPNLPDGTSFQNTASIIFDFNPPIITNTVYHTIGTLTVDLDEPQRHTDLWQVAGNPTRDEATFRALTAIAGEKRFELYDISGRPVRLAKFFGQSFVFQRDGVPAGVYFFRIADEQGRWFTGKIVVTD